MEQSEIIEKLREIAAKTPTALDADEKAFILEQAEVYGVAFKHTRCAQCYVDAAVAIFAKIKEQDATAVVEEIEAAAVPTYALRNGVDVYWCGERVNEATATADAVKRWVSSGMPLVYFSKIEAADDAAAETDETAEAVVDDAAAENTETAE